MQIDKKINRLDEWSRRHTSFKHFGFCMVLHNTRWVPWYPVASENGNGKSPTNRKKMSIAWLDCQRANMNGNNFGICARVWISGIRNQYFKNNQHTNKYINAYICVHVCVCVRMCVHMLIKNMNSQQWCQNNVKSPAACIQATWILPLALLALARPAQWPAPVLAAGVREEDRWWHRWAPTCRVGKDTLLEESSTR